MDTPCKNAAQNSVVCLGFFDGVHTGHLRLLRTARQIADHFGLICAAHTFDVCPGKGKPLTTLPERVSLLRFFGADTVYVTVFDDRVRNMSGEDFVKNILIGQMNAVHLVCGSDHRFGRGGACDIRALREICVRTGLALTVVPDECLNGQRVSSTLIRKLVEAGDLEQADLMLGRKWLGDEASLSKKIDDFQGMR